MVRSRSLWFKRFLFSWRGRLSRILDSLAPILPTILITLSWIISRLLVRMRQAENYPASLRYLNPLVRQGDQPAGSGVARGERFGGSSVFASLLSVVVESALEARDLALD